MTGRLLQPLWDLFDIRDLQARLQPPPWILILLFAIAATALICWPVWPGYMSFDSLLAYEQALYGVQTSLWPPMHTYLFVISRMLGAGPGAVFAFQTFSLFFGAALTLHMLAPRRLTAWILCAVLVFGMFYFPTLLGTLVAQWRDVPTAGFAVLGLGLWLAAAQRRSRALLAVSVLAFGLSLALRYNGFPLVLFVLALMIWRPFLGASDAGLRLPLAAGLVGVTLLAWSSTQWRLPDFARLQNPDSLGGTQVFDLAGISACTGHNYLPLAATSGQPITVGQIRRVYDPRHLHLTLRQLPGVPRLREITVDGEAAATWRRLLRTETGCYLAHRREVFIEQMGMARAGVFYPTHGMIDANKFDIELARPAASKAVNAYITRTVDKLWRRPFLIYVFATALTAACLWLRRWESPVLLAMLVGAYGYLSLLFVAAPAADARYIFPPNLVCLLLSLTAAGALFDHWTTSRARHGS
jgi:hypothetical protein